MDSAIATGRRPAPPVSPEGRSHRAADDAVVRGLGALSLLLSLGWVGFWWATAGGIGQLGTWAGTLTSTGRLTGLLAADLLLVQVILMARIPLLEGSFGQDRLVRHHRVIGFTSFVLMLTHIGLVVWGYAAGDLLATPATAWDLTLSYPGMLLAVAGTACLVMVVVTSIKAARSRLRYESWHLMHLYAYLGAGLALPHQLWMGTSFTSSTATTVFWWGLWGLAAGAVLVWRVALPLWRSARHRLRVTAVVPETPGIVSVHLTGRGLDRLGAEPGQFFGWRFLGRRGWTRSHPYSLSAPPDGATLRITVKEVGDGSRELAGLRPGTRVLVEGPYGRLSPRVRTREKVALIGAGVGITPLRALAEGLDYAPGDAVLILRHAAAPLFVEELDELQVRRGLRVIDLPGRRRYDDSWLGGGVAPGVDDAEALLRLVPDLAEHDVYVCGPGPWTEAVRRASEAAGLPRGQLHVESFGW